MATRKLLNKKGNTLIFQSVMFGIMVIGFILMTQAMRHDGYYSDYVSSGVSEGEEPGLTSSGFFANKPVFIGLPSWVLLGYSIFGVWGILLIMGWVRGAS